VHRDLKPANILLKPDGSVKVLDFGLAKTGGAAAANGSDPEVSPTFTMGPTQAGMILGTAAYMSPEQARGKTATTRADIWAFGVVLHEMLTGKRLFEGEDLAETLAAVVKEQPDLSAAPREVRRCWKPASRRTRRSACKPLAIGNCCWIAPSRLLRNPRDESTRHGSGRSLPLF
jgi:eukaryotic-like serine/threonine-protein kinase